MRKHLVVILMLLLFLSSCSKRQEYNYKDLLANNQYQELYEVSTNKLQDSLDQDSLYYKTVSSYYLGFDDEAVESAILYLSMYKENKLQINRILLYKADDTVAYEAGLSLLSETEVKTIDKIQMLKVLNNLEKKEEIVELCKSLKTILSSKDYFLALLNTASSTDVIIDGLGSLFHSTGVSDEFLEISSFVLDALAIRGGEQKVYDFLSYSFSENPTYAVQIAKYGYQTKNPAFASFYLEFAKSKMPDLDVDWD